jgi:hypothetical protein
VSCIGLRTSTHSGLLFSCMIRISRSSYSNSRIAGRTVRALAASTKGLMLVVPVQVISVATQGGPP